MRSLSDRVAKIEQRHPSEESEVQKRHRELKAVLKDKDNWEKHVLESSIEEIDRAIAEAKATPAHRFIEDPEYPEHEKDFPESFGEIFKKLHIENLEYLKWQKQNPVKIGGENE